MAILWTTYVVMRDVLLNLPWSWTVIEVNSEGELTLVNSRDVRIKPKLLSSTFYHPNLTVLSFKQLNMAWYIANGIVITPMQVQDEKAYRQLRVWLKWWPHQADLEAEDDLLPFEPD